jgi:hypothetical protein
MQEPPRKYHQHQTSQLREPNLELVGVLSQLHWQIHRTGLIVSKRNIWVSSSIVDFVVELKAIAAFLVGYGGGGV